MGDPVVHFEINGPDGPALVKFYTELFGWKAQESEGEYFIVDTQAGSGINGGVGTIREGRPAGVMFYASSPDLQASLKKAESLGGSIALPIVKMEMVTFAKVADPEGNVVGIVAPGEGEPPPRTQGDGREVGWWEVLGKDASGLRDFYLELFGWTINQSVEGMEYYLIDTDSGGVGIYGGIGASPDGQPHVNVYARVDDLQKYCEIAESLGGKVIAPPTQAGENTQIATFADPQGNTFGLFVGM